MSYDSENDETTLNISSDDTAGADVVISLEGQFGASAFTLAGRDILLTAGAIKTGSGTLNGTAGNDLLTGAATADKLFGKAGADVLNGAAGNDNLTGGYGPDGMTGGAGADQFSYTSILDSTPGTLYRDVISDFTHLSDKLNLKSIDANPVLYGNQAFKFVTTGFTG